MHPYIYICNTILFSEFHQKIQASSLGCKIVANKKLNRVYDYEKTFVSGILGINFSVW